MSPRAANAITLLHSVAGTKCANLEGRIAHAIAYLDQRLAGVGDIQAALRPADRPLARRRFIVHERLGRVLAADAERVVGFLYELLAAKQRFDMPQ